MRSGITHALTMLWLAGVSVSAGSVAAATLSGTVRDTLGAPIAGAIVRPYSAAPLRGGGLMHDAGPVCPTCWRDCAKRAVTDTGGRFEIAGLDKSLRFRVLVTAGGHLPAFVERVRTSSPPLDVRLVPSDPRDVPGQLLVTGRVLDPAGRPIEGACLRQIGHRSAGLVSIGDGIPGAAVAVSDEAGRFALVQPDPHAFGVPAGVGDGQTSWVLEAEARGWASAVVDSVPCGHPETRIHLDRGARLSGRIVAGGRGIAGVAVSARAEYHEAACWIPAQQLVTDAHGRFEFTHLPARTDVAVYVVMTSFSPYGGAALRRCHTAGQGSATRLGDILPPPARHLAGRVLLADGTPPPAHTLVSLGRTLSPRPGPRQPVWPPGLGSALNGSTIDFWSAWTDSAGRFAFGPLPAESLDVLVQLKGWRPEPRPPFRGGHMPYGVCIADRGDVDLVIRMTPADH